MTPFPPMLACHGMSLRGDELAMVLSVLGLWLSGTVPTFVNLYFLARMKRSVLFMLVNGGYFAGYVIAALWLIQTAVNNDAGKQPSPPLILAIPSLPIAHFLYLSWTRKKLRASPVENATIDTSST